MAKPLTTAERRQILDLHHEGLSRNEIGRKTGRSAATVTAVCKQAGLDFDRSHTEKATAAKVADSKALRTLIASDTLAAVHQASAIIQERLSGDTSDETLKDLTTVFGILVDKHGVLVKMDQANENHSAVDAWLDHITAGRGTTEHHEKG